MCSGFLPKRSYFYYNQNDRNSWLILCKVYKSSMYWGFAPQKSHTMIWGLFCRSLLDFGPYISFIIELPLIIKVGLCNSTLKFLKKMPRWTNMLWTSKFKKMIRKMYCKIYSTKNIALFRMAFEKTRIKVILQIFLITDILNTRWKP